MWKIYLYVHIALNEKRLCTGQSNSSAVCFLLLQKRVQAEKARETVEYVEKAVDIRRQKAVINEEQLFSVAQAERKKVDLETDLNLLQHRKDGDISNNFRCIALPKRKQNLEHILLLKYKNPALHREAMQTQSWY